MTNFQNIVYNGQKTSEALDKFCKINSQGCYVLCMTIFSEVVITKRKNLPSSKHSPTDYPKGYYHNGKLFQWSNSRIIAAQNAGMTKD